MSKLNDLCNSPKLKKIAQPSPVNLHRLYREPLHADKLLWRLQDKLVHLLRPVGSEELIDDHLPVVDRLEEPPEGEKVGLVGERVVLQQALHDLAVQLRLEREWQHLGCKQSM